MSQIALSIVVPNYNYADYVGIAVDSVLTQGRDDVEVIVVDDCSADNSREVIAGYGDRIVSVFHEANAGHGGAFNSGFARAQGPLVMFLDADDFLLPGALDTIIANAEPGVAIYHYRMQLADEEGVLSDVFPPEQRSLASGDLSRKLREDGRYDSTITSGLVFSRDALSRVMPMDPEIFRQGADGYLSAVIPLYGESRSYDTVISGYRRHVSNHSSFAGSLSKRARWCIEHDTARYQAIRHHAGALELPVAEELGAQDAMHIEARLTSLLLDPGQHPISADTRADLARRGMATIPDDVSGKRRLGLKAWWLWLRYAPAPLARTALIWKLDASSRPKAIAVVARWLRRRAGIVLN